MYGVEERIRFVQGDARELVPTFTDPEALLFVDPPWGRDWSQRGRCGLSDVPLLADLMVHGSCYWQMWAKLPPVFALDALPNAELEAVFGEAPGDRRRIKFVLARVAG